jgi:hypothetical protein
VTDPASLDLDHLEKLSEAATPGPWYTVDLPWRPPGCGGWIVAGNPDPHVGKAVLDSIDIEEWDAELNGPDWSQSDADLEFAAAARAAVPAMCRELRRLRLECARWEQVSRDAEAAFAANRADWHAYSEGIEAEVERLRAALTEIAKETGTPYARTADAALTAAERRPTP